MFELAPWRWTRLERRVQNSEADFALGYTIWECSNKDEQGWLPEYFYRPTAPNQHNPKMAPITIATGGGTLNHVLPAYVTVATTTHHGSLPRLCPSLLS